MLLRAAAADLAYHGARVGLGGDSLLPKSEVALAHGPVQSAAEIVTVIKAAAKPVRIIGEKKDGILRLFLNPISADAEAARRFQIRLHNLGSQPPLLEPDASDSVTLLVIAFENLLQVSKAHWREFISDYWIDGPLSWSVDYPHSEWAKRLGIPSTLLDEARAVVLLGYHVGNQLRSPFIPSGWEAA